MQLDTWVVVDVLRLAVGGLALDLHHLRPRRRLGGHVHGDKPHRHVLRHLYTGGQIVGSSAGLWVVIPAHLDHIGLLGDGDSDLHHLGWACVVQ